MYNTINMNDAANFIKEVKPYLVIWDFDGTIVDSEPAQEESWRSIFRDYKVAVPDNFFDAFLAQPLSVIKDYIHEDIMPLDKLSIDDMVVDKNVYLTKILLDTPPNDFVIPALNMLKELHIPSIIISNGNYDFITSYLDNHNLSNNFKEIHTNRNTPNFVKGEQIIKYYHKFNNVILVEDSKRYLKLVKPDFAKTIGVIHSYNEVYSELALSENDADLIIRVDYDSK